MACGAAGSTPDAGVDQSSSLRRPRAGDDDRVAQPTKGDHFGRATAISARFYPLATQLARLSGRKPGPALH
jgi:hypothetical protein